MRDMECMAFLRMKSTLITVTIADMYEGNVCLLHNFLWTMQDQQYSFLGIAVLKWMANKGGTLVIKPASHFQPGRLQ